MAADFTEPTSKRSAAEDFNRAAWAEQLDSFGPDARHDGGAESRAKTRAELESALGGAQELARILRGRSS
jgi:hypothetical protein